MITKLKAVSPKVIIIAVVYTTLLLMWLYIFLNELVDTKINYYFGAIIALVPLIASYFGFYNAKKWGGAKSIMGRSILFFSLGFLTWSIGTLIFAYYNIVLGVEVPYPSIADLSYVLTTPFWALGIANLSKAIGASFSIKTLKGKFTLFSTLVLTVVFSYYLLFVFARGGVFDYSGSGIKIIFDILYPVESMLMLALTAVAYSLSYKYLGGRYKVPTLILLTGFILNYLADFSFAYTTTTGAFYVGSWVDMLFGTAMFILTTGLLLFDANLINQEQK